jgi:hypothetical protein
MGKYAKAIVGALIAGLGVVEFALVDDVVTYTEWVRVSVTSLAALGIVWGVSNDKPAVDKGIDPDSGAAVTGQQVSRSNHD